MRGDHLEGTNWGQLALMLNRQHGVGQTILLRVVLGHHLDLVLLVGVLIGVPLRRLRLALSLHVQQHILRIASKWRGVVIVGEWAMVLIQGWQLIEHELISAASPKLYL